LGELRQSVAQTDAIPAKVGRGDWFGGGERE
jgi:hypothetical protein